MNNILYKKEIEEADAKRIVRQLLNGLNNLHSQGMVHRDVQPENIRFRGASFEKTELVLLPSEDVALHEPTSPKHKMVGEGEEKKVKIFHAPERLLGDFSASSDLWSVGVLMYILICGEPPFSEPCGDSEAMYDQVASTKIDFERDPWPELPVARDLCKKLLTIDPSARTPTSAAALQHPWLYKDLRAANYWRKFLPRIVYVDIIQLVLSSSCSCSVTRSRSSRRIPVPFFQRLSQYRPARFICSR